MKRITLKKAIHRFFDYLILRLSDCDGMCQFCDLTMCKIHPNNKL